MRKLLEYTWLEFKVLFRIPIALFFTILFPQILLSVFVITSKNAIVYNDIHFVDIYLPVMMLLTLFSSGIISFSVVVAGNRSEKLWQIYRLRGFKLPQIIISQLIVNITQAFISVICLIIVAKFAFKAQIPNALNLLKFFVVWLIIAISIFLIGFLIGVFCRNEKIAQSVGTPIMFILMVLSGIMIDINIFPQKVQEALLYIPTTQANKILVNNWIDMGGTGSDIKWFVVIIWIIISFAFILFKLYRDDFKRI